MGPYALLFSAGLQAYGAYMQGQASADALNRQADIQMQNAQEALVKGQYDAAKSDTTWSKRIGGQAADFGASGVTSNSGSVLAVLGDSAANAERDRMQILHGAGISAIRYQNAASLERQGAAAATQGGALGALGALAGAGLRIGANSQSATPTTNTTPIPVESVDQ